MKMESGSIGIKELFEALGRGQTEAVRIGRVSPQRTKEFRELVESKERMKTEIEKKLSEYAEQLREVYEPGILESDRKTAVLWETIFDEMNVPEDVREDEFELDRNTGVLTHHRDRTDDQEEERGPLQ